MQGVRDKHRAKSVGALPKMALRATLDSKPGGFDLPRRPYFPFPLLLFVGSTNVYDFPGPVVGGIVVPFGTVTSWPLPPRGPISWYCPDFGAVCPGLIPLVAMKTFSYTAHNTATLPWRGSPQNPTRYRLFAALHRGGQARARGLVQPNKGQAPRCSRIQQQM